MNFKLTTAILSLCSTAFVSVGQVVLSGSSYTENFNAIESTSPAGWTFYTGATANGLSDAVAYVATEITWGDGINRFKNVAATTGLAEGDKQLAQNGSADRALGLRPGDSFGNPGAAFVFNFDSTGYTDVTVSLDAMVNKVKGMGSTWTLDYSVDGGSNWTAITTWSDPGTFGRTAVASSISITALANQSNGLIRFAALTAATGTGSANGIAIDNFSLSYSAAGSAVPEPSSFALLAGLGAMGLVSTRRRRRA